MTAMWQEEYNTLGAVLAGIDPDFDDDSDESVISGDEDLDDFVGAALRVPNTQALLARMGRARVSPKFGRTKMGSIVGKLKNISRQVLLQTGRLEADYLRRPNTLCSIYTTALAPGASVAFQVTPGNGNSFYRLLGFICTDDQSNVMGFSSLRVGGQEHVNFTQSTPTAPVASAVPWAIYQLKESRLAVNLAPWTGQVFDQSSPLLGTVVNMTVAGNTDAATVTGRMVVLTQTDPCGMRYPQLTEQSKGWWKSLRRNVGAYAPLYLNR